MAGEWSLQKDEVGIKVYTQEREGSSFKAFKGEAVVDAPLMSVVAVLYDTPACKTWMYECSYATNVKLVRFEENYIFQQYELGFPVSDRGVLLHSVLHFDKEGARIDSHEVMDFCDNGNNVQCNAINQRDFVPVVRSRGSFVLTPIAADKTKVVWTQHTNPGGSLPTWLVNAMLIDSPFYSLLKLKTVVKEEKYQISKEALVQRWRETVKAF